MAQKTINDAYKHQINPLRTNKMKNVGRNSFEFTGITSGTKVLVSAGDGRWEERIFLTSILGAWHPYICVSEHDEEEYLQGNAFDVTFWLDLKEIEGGRTIVLPMSPFLGVC